MTQIVRIFNIEGKDFLDQYEAAHYMSMSLSYFKQILPDTPIKALNNHGKIIYRKKDLTKHIESQLKK